MRAIIFSAGMSGPATNIDEVRSVLDSVAERTGPSSWFARLSDEMLVSVRRALINVLPTRKVFVVAYTVSGFANKRLHILWTVGERRIVNESGNWIIKRRRKPSAGTTFASSGNGMTALIARAAYIAGLSHDIGKDTSRFQSKLGKNAALADPVRHEVISLKRIFRSDHERWQMAPEKDDSLQWHHYLVLTHHRLPIVNENDGSLDLASQCHIREDLGDMDESWTGEPHTGALPSCLINERLPVSNVAAFVYSRLALMLADHYVSSLANKQSGALAYVTRNLTKLDGEMDETKANPHQNLIGHMMAVGRLARSLSGRLLNGRWMAGMTGVAPEKLLARASGDGRFAWQKQAVDFVSNYAGNLGHDMGGLVFVGATTGSGKTRACAAMAAAMARGEVRLTVALGLRSLTLQTYRTYAEEIDLEGHEVDIVIGSKAYKDLYVADESEHGDPEKEEYITYGAAWEGPANLLPPIAAQCRGKGDRRYLRVPILVCTIDQVIKAADHRRSSWIKPWLRLQSSSAIIIDEIDGFGLEDAPALLRLIYFAGMLGKHVLISSATIYPALAERILRAYAAGSQQRAGMLGIEHEFKAAIVGDAPGVNQIVTEDDFTDALTRYAQVTHEWQSQVVKRRFVYIGESAQNSEEMRRAIMDACIELHQNNRIAVDDLQTAYSIGMVRLSHVRNVVAMARHLDEWVGQNHDPRYLIRVIVYHSRNTMLARAYIEEHLDAILKRKDRTPIDHPLVRQVVEQAATMKREAIIIVITTLEEVGQDHDYDWAVIEPSSARSIVQTSGRVRRHRDGAVEYPNVAIMRHNFRYLENDPEKRRSAFCFYAPGFEVGESRFHKPAKVQGISSIACLMPEKESLGWFDNDSIEKYLSGAIDKWVSSTIAPLSCAHYSKHGFRKRNKPETPIMLDQESMTWKSPPDKRVVTGRLLKHSGLFSVTWSEICQHFGIEAPTAEHCSLTIYGEDVSLVDFIDEVYGAAY